MKKKVKTVDVELRLPKPVAAWYEKLAADALVPVEHALSVMLVLIMRREKMMEEVQRVAKERSAG